MNPNVTEHKLMYAARDGRKYGGADAREVVDAMRVDSSFTAAKSIEEYMHGAASRHSRYDNIIVRADTPEHFLHDLEAGGVLKKLFDADDHDPANPTYYA